MNPKLIASLTSAALLMGCGSNDSYNSQTSTTTGIEIPTNAVEIADGLYVYQDGAGNWMQIDLELADASPRPIMIAQSGTNNAMSISVRPFVPPAPPPEEGKE